MKNQSEHPTPIQADVLRTLKLHNYTLQADGAGATSHGYIVPGWSRVHARTWNSLIDQGWIAPRHGPTQPYGFIEYEITQSGREAVEA